MALLERFPMLVWAGAAPLGWIAGELLASDPVIATNLSAPTTLTLETSSAMFGSIGYSRLEVDLNLVEMGAIGVVVTSSVCLRSRRPAEARGIARDPRKAFAR